jgi:uncharacterized protein (TIGR03000 family)
VRPPVELKPTGAARPAPGRLLVSIPADARLIIDRYQSVSTSNSRRFVTPNLVPGETYYYTLKAEQIRAGKTETVTERVAVRAGQESRVNIVFPSTATASR